MLVIETKTLEMGVRKTIANAGDLIETAEVLHSLNHISNIEGYRALFTQTALAYFRQLVKSNFVNQV